MTLQASLAVSVESRLLTQNAVEELESLQSLAMALAIAHGTGVNQCTKRWAAERTVLSDATDNIDLSGTLAGLDGQTVQFSSVKLLLIQHMGVAGGGVPYLEVKPSATAPWGTWGAAGGSGFNLSPGGIGLLWSPVGYSVSSGVEDRLAIAAEDGNVTYRIVVLGT